MRREVYQRLSAQVGKEKLLPQLQFAGFRIDLVYDPQDARIPKIAIECDGAKYHSSREAYLHDRHRQKILEGHGFVFHRIWSTNWWRNPERELKKLVSVIRNVEDSVRSNSSKKPNLSIAFTDEILPIENQVASSIVATQENDLSKVETIQFEQNISVADSAIGKVSSKLHCQDQIPETMEIHRCRTRGVSQSQEPFRRSSSQGLLQIPPRICDL
ncbi:MAG: DUF559 domain-containing protein [Bacteroidetes bacterium]|nr:DUF559 domain-containing protein [Bacteroidota bacterium]